jgi:peptidoglycan hydrolase-like protein with peptidoglycan-binding domain
MAELKQGVNGSAVRRLQQLLNANKARQPPLVADGRFGSLTRAAVVAFQTRKRLTATGIVSEDTWKALEATPLARVVDRYRVGPQEMLADIAAQYVGTTEANGNRMGDDQRLREIFQADDLVN